MAVDITSGLDFFGVGSSIIKVVVYGVGIILVLIGVALFGKSYGNKKKFNIPVTIWIPRSDNKIVDEVNGRGGYFKSKAVGGITTFRLKRKGISTIEIEPPASRFLVGLSRHLYLVQKGMDDFEPVLPESFMTVETAKISLLTGKQIRKAVVNLKCINQDSTAWRFDNETTAKKRFTFLNLWEKYKDFIQLTIFILMVFVICYINYQGLKEVAAALKEVAQQLAPAISNAPQVS